MAEKKKGEGIKLVQKNRKAYYNYEIVERLEAGLVLKGSEVKSIRNGALSIHEGYCKVKKGEVWVFNINIDAYKEAGPMNHEPKRPRKLLLKYSEINKIITKTEERGLVMVPLSLYFKGGYAKLEIGLGRGKKEFDKRDTIKKRDADRDLRKRMMK